MRAAGPLGGVCPHTSAIGREKELKGWRRSKKIALIETQNPEWKDLAASWGKQILFPGQSMNEGS
jgi:putative endonuclease